MYKLLLKRPLALEDLQYVDEQVYNSMLWIRDNSIDGILDLNFTVLEERFGITEEKGAIKVWGIKKVTVIISSSQPITGPHLCAQVI